MQIQCLAEDKDGFIWVGTTNGLYRFDAHGFKHYKATETDSLGLAENYITALFVTNDNQLWIGTERKGVVWFDKTNDRFVAIKNEINSLNKVSPSEFVEDKEGNIWFANKGGNAALGFIDKYTHQIRYYKIPKALVRGRGFNGISISFTQSGNIYLGTTDGLVFFNTATKSFENNHWLLIESFNEFTITQQIKGDSNSIWLSLFGYGLLHFMPASGKFDKFPLKEHASNGKVNVCSYSKNELLVFAGKKKLFIFNTQTGIYKPLEEVNQTGDEGFSTTHAMLKSKEDVFYWGGSNGLYSLDTKNQPAKLITIPGLIPNKEYKLNSLLYNPKDSSYYAGLFLVKNFSVLKWHQRTLAKSYFKSITHPKLGQYINKLLLDTGGKVYCNDYYHLYYLNPTTSALVAVFQTTNFPNQYISDFFIDHQNQIWITLSQSGLAKITSPYTIETPNRQGKKKEQVRGFSFIGQDEQKLIWLYTSNGLSSYNTQTNTFINFNIGNPNDLIVSACFGKDNTFWITKYGKGIYRFNPLNKQERFYGESDGLGSNLFKNDPVILVNNKIWTLSTSFLSCLNLTTNQFQNYSGKDLYDLQTINPNNDFMISLENEFISASPKGIIICDLDRFDKAVNEPRAFINAIKVWGKNWMEAQDLNEVKTIDLNHDENYLTIGFSSLSFRQDEANQYSYYLDGFDKEWHISTTEKQVTYTSLPSGTYTFNLKASNYAGVWDKQPKQIFIIIRPPFWQTWWFVSLMLFLILAIAYLIVRSKIRSVRAAAQLENQHNIDLMEFELKALKAQINPHFLFNALSAIQQQILSQNITDAHKYLGKFAKLLRSTLDLSDRRTIQLEDEVDLLKNYLELEKVRFKNKFTYTIEVDKHLLAENPDIPGMIVQPYIENAIMHGLLNLDNGKEGILSIQFESLESAIQCTITDNGVGRQKAALIKLAKGKTHASKGIAITENRINLIAKLYKGKSKAQIIDLVDAFNNAVGTQVILQIPVMTVNPA